MTPLARAHPFILAFTCVHAPNLLRQYPMDLFSLAIPFSFSEYWNHPSWPPPPPLLLAECLPPQHCLKISLRPISFSIHGRRTWTKCCRATVRRWQILRTNWGRCCIERIKKSRDEKGGVVWKAEENEPHWPTSCNQIFF